MLAEGLVAAGGCFAAATWGLAPSPISRFPRRAAGLQIIEIRGIDPPDTPVVFDNSGKHASKQYYDRIFAQIARYGYTIYSSTDYNTVHAGSIKEYYYKEVAGVLVPADSFEDCEFYECTFYTADQKQRDMGIVAFCYYTAVNTGHQVQPVRPVP